MIRCPWSGHHVGVTWRHHSGVTSARAAIPGEGEGQAPRHALALTCASDVTGGVIDEEKSAVERQIPGRSHLPSQPSGRGGVAGIMVLGKTQHPQKKFKSTRTPSWVAVCFCVPGHGYSLIWFVFSNDFFRCLTSAPTLTYIRTNSFCISQPFSSQNLDGASSLFLVSSLRKSLSFNASVRCSDLPTPRAFVSKGIVFYVWQLISISIVGWITGCFQCF